MDRTANAENAFKCSVGSNPTLSALVLVQDSGDDPSLTVRIVSRFAVARGVGARQGWPGAGRSWAGARRSGGVGSGVAGLEGGAVMPEFARGSRAGWVLAGEVG